MQSNVRQILSIQSKRLQKSRRSSAREKGQLHLTLNSLLPPQAASLSIVEKVHIYSTYILDLLCDALMDRFQRLVTDKELVITGSDPVGLPYSIQRGKHQRRMDLKVTHEEADVIIVNHVVHIAKQPLPKTIHVISDNTDVFVLLVHFVASEGPRCKLILVPTRPTKNTINIGSDRLATVDKHAEIAKCLLPLDVLTAWL